MKQDLLDLLADSMGVFISDLRLIDGLRDEALHHLKGMVHPSEYTLMEWQRTLFYLTGRPYLFESYRQLEDTLNQL